jgi:hypothetical protein
VTARRSSGLPAGVTLGYPAFGFEAHQPSAHARHLLAQAGLAISEALTCGLGGGIGFMYSIFEYRESPFPLLTIVAQHHPQPWLEAVAEHLGIPLSVVTSSSIRAAQPKLDATLDGAQAAQLIVGRGHLPWHEDVPPDEAAAPHEIVVAGRSGDGYLVDDGGVQHISFVQLGEAWAAHRKNKFAITTIPAIASVPDLGAAVRASIATTVGHLTGPVLGHSFDSNFGLSGMEKFAAELRDTTTKTGWVRRFGSPDAFRVALTRIEECLSWQYTGVGGTRPLYAEFLREAAGVSSLNLASAATAADAAGEQWSRLASTSRDAAATGADPVPTFAALADIVDLALTAERELVARLEEAIA